LIALRASGNPYLAYYISHERLGLPQDTPLFLLHQGGANSLWVMSN